MSDILSILNSIGYVTLVDSGEVWRTKPLYRDSDNPTVLCIKKSNGQWYDHAERVGGGLAQLVQRTLNLPSLKDTKNYIGDVPISISNTESIELCDVKKFDKASLIKLVNDGSYWVARGVSNYTLSKFSGGVAATGRMKDRYVFPIFDERNDLIGFSGRLLYKSASVPKWKHLGQKKNFIFPSSSSEVIMKTKEVILVESIGDCLKMMECGIFNVLVSFGVSLSPKIVQHLLKLDVQKIIISLNNDEENGFVGNKASKEYQKTLSSFFDESQLVIALPTAKDFGEMSCEEIYSWKKQYLN